MSTKTVLLGVLAGAAAGTILGILFAPDKGTVTRKKIAGKPEDLTDALKNKFNDFMDEIKKETEMVKQKTHEFMSADGVDKTERFKSK